MRPLHTRLQEARKRLGIRWDILERDYLISWVLAGIGQVGPLRDTLVFKGGTALKKCYFGDYRFSEDLDFSGLEGVPTGDVMEYAIQEVCNAASKLQDEYAHVPITCERYTENDPHPAGQEAFILRARFPWQNQPQTRVMIETTIDEKVLKAPVSCPVIHGYGESVDTQIQVYALEEVVAEKLRAILQHLDKLDQRGWSRSRARDYYDIWRILGAHKDNLDMRDFVSFLRQKCAVRNVDFTSSEDFFQERMLAYVGNTWEQWLGQLVPDLPAFQKVIDDLRPQIAGLIERESD